MIFSRKTHALLLIMSVIKKHYNAQPITAVKLSEITGFSLSYIEQMIGNLRDKEFLRSVRGPNGGYEPVEGIFDERLTDVFIRLETEATAQELAWVDCLKRSVTFSEFINLTYAHGEDKK